MFENAAMLAGLGGAVIPVVLHLLARARHRTVDWGAMMFLAGRDWRQNQSSRLRQWSLLALRTALVSVLALALARPVVRSRQAGVGASSPVTAVILLDRSGSMGCEEAGRTRFDKAREAVLQILGSLQRGDEASLIVLGGRTQVVHQQPTSNLQAVARQLSELTVADGPADLLRGLDCARAILEESGSLRREIYLVCDRQAASWRELLRGSGAEFRGWLNRSSSDTRFFVVPVGGTEMDNVAVEQVELSGGLAVRQQPAEAEVRLRNYGRSACPVEVRLQVIGPADPLTRAGIPATAVRTATVTLAPGASQTVRIPVEFQHLGSHVLLARISGPGLQADNEFAAVVDVVDPIPVLVLSGDESVEQMRREAFFLRVALSPYRTALQRSGDNMVVSVRGLEEWARVDLSRYRVVILANVPELTAEQARILEQRVYEGTGLILAPGNLSRVGSYNEVLYRQGSGLMPAKLIAPVAADRSQSTTLLGMELTHPVFRFLRGSGGPPGAVVGRYFPAVPRPADASVLATFASGEPFLIEGRFGRGRVLLLTTPLDADWNTLPLQSFYLPFVQSMVRYAGASSLAQRRLSPDQPIVAVFGEVLEEKPATLTREGQNPVLIPVSGGQNRIVYSQVREAGIYRLEAHVRGSTEPRVMHFVVDGLRDDPDLTALSAEQWEMLAREYGFSIVRMESSGQLALELARRRRGTELWLYLVLGVVGLALGETYLARRWTWEVPG